MTFNRRRFLQSVSAILVSTSIPASDGSSISGRVSVAASKTHGLFFRADYELLFEVEGETIAQRYKVDGLFCAGQNVLTFDAKNLPLRFFEALKLVGARLVISGGVEVEFQRFSPIHLGCGDKITITQHLNVS